MWINWSHFLPGLRGTLTRCLLAPGPDLSIRLAGSSRSGPSFPLELADLPPCQAQGQQGPSRPQPGKSWQMEGQTAGSGEGAPRETSGSGCGGQDTGGADVGEGVLVESLKLGAPGGHAGSRQGG